VTQRHTVARADSLSMVFCFTPVNQGINLEELSMKRTLPSLLAAFMLVSPLEVLAHPAECHFVSGGYQMGPNAFDGPTECSAGTLDALTVNGPLTLKGTTVKTLSLNGPLTMEHATVHSLTVNGVVHANQSHIERLTMKGKVYLLNSEVSTIVFPSASDSETYAVYLQGSTVVTSKIDFEKGHGEVYQSKTSVIKGTVHGAVVHAWKD
jgi:hypothetical protein